MHQDKIKWNEKYKHADAFKEASPVVRKHWPLAPRGRALDIAAGMGRNSMFLARKGFVVDAVDISEKGLGKLAGRHSRVHPICADLDVFDIPAERYSLIINIRFLNRRLFPYIREGLTPGGILIFESYLETPEVKTDEPFCRDYLLRANELLHAFLSLGILYYREGEGSSKNGPRRIASLVARKEDST